MLRLRVVNTVSKAKAIQVVSYKNGKRFVVHHVGSGHTDEELDVLLDTGREWIAQQSGQLSFFEEEKENDNVLILDHCEYLGVYYTFLYNILHSIHRHIGYSNLCTSLLTDLVIMRIFEPASKLRSIELLETYFDIRHRRQAYYEAAPKWLSLKEKIEKQTVCFAQKEFHFDYSLLFYDVTTLYFETFEADQLRKPGFSKDGKSSQPQILVALMVSPEGFPLAYEVYSGNTFEGHTLIPTIQSFIQKHQIKHFTVVADAAMISADNIQALKQADIRYIVGARLGNLSAETLKQIDQLLHRKDGNIIRLTTDNGFLICSYSQARYRKDKYEMEKQIERAKDLVKHPSKNKKAKFIKSHIANPELNSELITKTQMLLGIKGYYTDLEEKVSTNTTIIERYHDLYKIEQAFRISKHDLQARPVFHFKEEPIKLHLLICFMALVISKYIELTTKTSLRYFLTECKKITDAHIYYKLKKKTITMRRNLTPAVKKLISSLNLPH